MTANIEFEDEAEGDVKDATSATRKRLFLADDGFFKTKDSNGVVAPVSSLTIGWLHNATVTNPAYSVGSPYTAIAQETVKVDPSGGQIRVNLPTAVGIPGVQIKVVSVSDSLSPNDIFVYPDGAEVINGDAFKTISTPRERFIFESDGVGWLVVD